MMLLTTVTFTRFVRFSQDDNTQDMTRLSPPLIGSHGQAHSRFNQSLFCVQNPQQ